jgi:hypothetical protein
MLDVREVRRPRLGRVAAIGLATLLTACGGGSDGGSEGGGGAVEVTGDTIDVCGLLSDSEIASLLGGALESKPAGSDAPYPGCSWNTGRLIVQVAPGNALVLAPGQDCPSVDIGDEAVACPGSVQFVVNDSRVIVQTIEDLTEDQLVAVARALAPKVSGA